MSRWGGGRVPSDSRWGRLSLPARDVQHQTVESIAHLDLAAEAAGGFYLEGEIQHVLFHMRRRADDFGPRLIDIDMAGGAGAGAAAFADNAGNRVHHRGFHNGGAVLRLDLDALAIGFNKSH